MQKIFFEGMNKLVEDIYGVLKRRHYNRGKPFHEKQLKQRVADFVSTHSPIDLVGFWGVGPKASANWSDKESCDFLQHLNEQVATVYPPAIQFTFVFAEPHGTHNGIPMETMESYISDIKNLFTDYGFHHRHLQPLWDTYGISFEKIESLLQQKTDGWWEQVPNYKDIEHNAKHRNQRMPAIDGAQRYVIMRDLEKEMWEKEYSSAIFHAFSDSTLRGVLPNMPTLYFFARQGWSNTPWFVTNEREVK